MGLVRLEPWRDGDLGLLRRQNSPEMTAFLGGPESEEKLLDRHRKYVEGTFVGHMRVIVLLDGEQVGSIGYWEHELATGTVWETGWGVLPEYQGRGIAGAAIGEMIAEVTAERTHRAVHAYPSVLNGASNAICRKAGFTLLAEIDFEYPKGHWLRCNDWCFELSW
ncbi:MAG: GNAT family N-acetyltransferase [Nocardioidaceae bacterium]